MLLEQPDNFNVHYSAADGGCTVNVSANMILLREPTAREIRKIFDEMQQELKSCLSALLCMPYGEVSAKYGAFNLMEAVSDEKSDVPYGALTTGFNPLNLLESAIPRGLVAIGQLPAMNEDGVTPRTRMPRGAGGAPAKLKSLSCDLQVQLLQALITSEPVDDYFKFDQAATVDLEYLDYRLSTLDDASVMDFLEEIVRNIDYQLNEASCRNWHQGKSRAKGTGYTFGPMWLAMMLSTKGIWLFPIDIYPSVMRAFFPSRLKPLTAFFAAPSEMRDVAESVLRHANDERYHIQNVLSAFVTASLSSDMWSSRRFCPYPLVVLKNRILTEDVNAVHRSSAINQLYSVLCQKFKIELADREESGLLTGIRRVNARTNDFNWVYNPTPKSTRFVSDLIGRPVTDVPNALKVWAERFRGMLKSFGVKYPKDTVFLLNAWLAFLLTLDVSDIPADFLQIDRVRHGVAFADFLTTRLHERGRRIDLLAVGKMKMAWDIAKKQEGFSADLANPFDVPLDNKGQPVVMASDREQMPMEVVAFFVHLNCKGDYEFARSLSNAFQRMKNRRTGEYDLVFFGLAAKVVDLCLNYGNRLIDARHMDSGEGDEYVVDLDTKEEVPNPLDCAQPGRKEGMIRRFWLDGKDARWELGIYRAHDKSNRPKFAEHLDIRIAKMVQELAELQNTYNPLDFPVQIIDRKYIHKDASPDKIRMGWPLFRAPNDRVRYSPVSEEIVRQYWKSLCEWVQPQLDEHLTYHFPLFIDGATRFKIHDLRVTAASEIVDLGHSIDVASGALGHEDSNTTLIYVAKKSEKIHAARHEVIESRAATLNRSPREVLEEAVNSAYTPAYLPSHAGVASGRKMLETGRLSKLSEFDHGLCPGGDCNMGGPVVSGKPTPVWRLRACSVCNFRLTGPRFKDGIVDNINRLRWEVFDSVRRERELNESLERYEAENGVDEVRRQDARFEAYHRSKLEEEFKAEVVTHKGVLAAERAALNAGLDPNSILIPGSPDIEADGDDYHFVRGTEYQLLHRLAGVKVLPRTIMVSSPALKERWNFLNRELMRATNFEKVLYSFPRGQHDEVIRAFSNVAIENLEPNEITKLLNEPVDLDAISALGPMMMQLKEELSTKRFLTDGR